MIRQVPSPRRPLCPDAPVRGLPLVGYPSATSTPGAAAAVDRSLQVCGKINIFFSVALQRTPGDDDEEEDDERSRGGPGQASGTRPSAAERDGGRRYGVACLCGACVCLLFVVCYLLLSAAGVVSGSKGSGGAAEGK